MKTKNLFIGLAIATIALSSCKQPNEVKDKRATLWDWAFSIYVSDINGNDLLDPSNPNGYKIDDIKLYYRLTDGTLLEGKREYWHRDMGDYDTIHNYDRYMLEFMLRPTNSEKYDLLRLTNSEKYVMSDSVLYIEWNKNDRDTIKSIIYNGWKDPVNHCNMIVWEKVWYNSELIADDWRAIRLRGSKPYPTIIKEGKRR